MRLKEGKQPPGLAPLLELTSSGSKAVTCEGIRIELFLENIVARRRELRNI